MRPKVMLILDTDKRPLGQYPIVDLIQDIETEEGRPLEIKRGLEPGAYGVDASELYL